jgi:MtfA peptidase
MGRVFTRKDAELLYLSPMLGVFAEAGRFEYPTLSRFCLGSPTMTATGTDARSALGTAFERRSILSANILAGIVLVGGLSLVVAARQSVIPPWAAVAVCVGAAWLLRHFLLRKVRRRREILVRSFPTEWEVVLQRDVAFFRALLPEEQLRFRRELQVFLGEKRITGIRTEVDTKTLVLVGASAVIPIFGFSDWEWDQIDEVLVYPARFNRDYEFEGGGGRSTLGMVGTGVMNRVMILAKPDLVQGFKNAGDKRNVGLHEFAHLVDKSDGTIDGIPAVGLTRESIGPWVDLVRRKMQEIAEGDSDINRYALTNEAEFFSVATEYFFERPGLMERKHPELFAMMEKVFRQDMKGRAQALLRESKAIRRQFGRNSPCPCGSGKKYKKCCLRR